METNAMEVKNLSFSYGSNQILSDISLTIPRGKITTIMGANGCGKSTLFSLMTKNLTPGKGKILLEEKSIKKYSLSEFARKVSIVHQHNSAAEDITIERLVSYGRTPYQKMLGGKSEEDERLIEQALQVTGLLDLRDREIGRLSGGQRQLLRGPVQGGGRNRRKKSLAVSVSECVRIRHRGNGEAADLAEGARPALPSVSGRKVRAETDESERAGELQEKKTLCRNR